jgi:8-oxo-dGTP diphosphatase
MSDANEPPIQVAIAVVEYQGRYLVGVRPAGVPLAGMAEFPGGKVNAGESSKHAAIRECREESGWDVEVVKEYFSTMHRYEHGLLQVHFFLCRPTDSRIPHPPPSPPFRWVDAAELETLNFPAANAPLTKMLLREAAEKSP